MNREILFRAKELITGRWIYGIPLFDWAGCSLKCVNQHNGELLTFFSWEDEFHEYNEFEVDVSTVGAYTGLKDKNGTKIFKGDIVQFLYGCLHLDGIVKFGCGTFDSEIYEYLGWYVESLADGNKDHQSLVELVRGDEFKVIGNIHDNPELLENVSRETLEE